MDAIEAWWRTGSVPLPREALPAVLEVSALKCGKRKARKASHSPHHL